MESTKKFNSWEQVEEYLKTLKEDLFKIQILVYKDIKDGELDDVNKIENIYHLLKNMIKFNNELIKEFDSKTN